MWSAIKKRLLAIELKPGPVIAGFLIITLMLSVTTKAILVATDKPEFCVICHVMEPQYDNWFHSAHRLGATCSDCHTPHQNLPIRLVNKGYDGTKDFIFFFANIVPEPIELSKRGSKIVRDNCLRCHTEVMANVIEREDRNCWDCHSSVRHDQMMHRYHPSASAI